MVQARWNSEICQRNTTLIEVKTLMWTKVSVSEIQTIIPPSPTLSTSYSCHGLNLCNLLSGSSQSSNLQAATLSHLPTIGYVVFTNYCFPQACKIELGSLGWYPMTAIPYYSTSKDFFPASYSCCTVIQVYATFPYSLVYKMHSCLHVFICPLIGKSFFKMS